MYRLPSLGAQSQMRSFMMLLLILRNGYFLQADLLELIAATVCHRDKDQSEFPSIQLELGRMHSISMLSRSS